MAYCTRQQIEDYFGVTNTDQWIDLDNTRNATNIAARYADTIAITDRFIDNYFRNSKYVVPLSPSSDGGSELIEIRHIAVRLSGVMIYNYRGLEEDFGDPTELTHKYSIHKIEAMAEMRKYRDGTMDLPALRSDTFPDSPQLCKG